MTFVGRTTCLKSIYSYAIVILSLYTCIKLHDCAIFSDVHWSTAIKLSRYEGYKSVSVLSYNIPEDSLHVDFTFQAKTSGSACTFQEVYVFFQHGSYPLVDIYNESYPEHFYTNRTDAHHVVVHQSSNVTVYRVSRPRSGIWYFAAFLPKATEEDYKIQQKGLNSKCLYGMFIMVTARGVDNIPEILTTQKHSLHLKKDHLNDQKIFRYRLPKETAGYTVTIDNCVIVMESSSDNVPNVDIHVGNDTNGSIETSYDTVKLRSLNSSATSPSPSSSLSSSKSPDVTANSKSDVPSTTTSSTSTKSTATTSTSIDTTASSNSSSPPPPPSTTTTTPPTPSTCPVLLLIQEEKLPSDNETEKIRCRNHTSCQKQFLSPVLEKWIYLDIALDSGVAEVTFDLSFDMEKCESMRFLSPNHIHYVNAGTNASMHDAEDLPQTACMLMDPLGRFMFSERAFNVTFLLADGGLMPVPIPLYQVHIPDYTVLVTAVQIREPIDIGGTLRMFMDATRHSLPEIHPQYAVMYLCLMKHAIPGGVNARVCPGGVSLAVNTTGEITTMVYIPYPESATYYLGLVSQCYSKDTHEAQKCTMYPIADIEVGLSGCVQNDCGDYGACRNYISGVYLFSSCVCFAGWRGYGCTDGTEASSYNEELTATLLLTLTNLFFIPSIIVALYRKYYVEAWVYFFTMFFSGMYHACDASDLVYYCMLDYDILSFSDFVGSITSFWVTLLAMANIPLKLRWFGHILGVMGVAVGTEYDKHGIWTFAIPAGLGITVMLVSWIVQCKKRSSLYPPKRYYLLQFLPGVLLAGTGLVLFAFFETEDNYKYTHSAWHFCMSTCILFLLPRQEKTESDSFEMKEVKTLPTTNEQENSDSSDFLVPE